MGMGGLLPMKIIFKIACFLLLNLKFEPEMKAKILKVLQWVIIAATALAEFVQNVLPRVSQ